MQKPKREENTNMHGEYLSKETKTCENCKIEKSLISFSPYQRKNGTYSKGGRNCNTCRCVLTRTSCKECEKVENLKYNKKRVDKIKLFEKQRWANMSPDEKQKRRENCRNNWRNKTPQQKKDCYDKYRKSIIKAHLVRRERIKSCSFTVPFTKFDIIKRDGLRCYLCNTLLSVETVTIEHLIPLCRGGSHKPENAKIACRSCNSSKNCKTLTEYKKYRGDYDRFQNSI